jgi:hypothetical protein
MSRSRATRRDLWLVRVAGPVAGPDTSRPVGSRSRVLSPDPKVPSNNTHVTTPCGHAKRRPRLADRINMRIEMARCVSISLMNVYFHMYAGTWSHCRLYAVQLYGVRAAALTRSAARVVGPHIVDRPEVATAIILIGQ